jgi:phage gp16-like protein
MNTMALDRRAYRGAPVGFARVNFDNAEAATKGQTHWSWNKDKAQRTAALKRWAKKMQAAKLARA